MEKSLNALSLIGKIALREYPIKTWWTEEKAGASAFYSESKRALAVKWLNKKSINSSLANLWISRAWGPFEVLKTTFKVSTGYNNTV